MFGDKNEIPKIDKTLLNDPLLALQNAYNTGEEKFVQQAISQLHTILQQPQSLERIAPIRSDLIEFSDNQNFIKSGIDWLDNSLGGGVRKQELMVIGGSPHAGKSTLMTFMSAQYIKQGLTVVHFNLEDILSDVMSRYGLVLDEVHKKQLYFIDNSNKLGVSDLDHILNNSEVKPDVVLVDYMDCIKSATEGQDWLESANIATGLRALAKKHDVFLLTGSQLNFPGNQVGMDRFFRSKVGKAAPSDLIFIIDEQINGEFFMTVAKAKGRNVKTKKFMFKLDFETMKAIHV